MLETLVAGLALGLPPVNDNHLVWLKRITSLYNDHYGDDPGPGDRLIFYISFEGDTIDVGGPYCHEAVANLDHRFDGTKWAEVDWCAAPPPDDIASLLFEFQKYLKATVGLEHEIVFRTPDDGVTWNLDRDDGDYDADDADDADDGDDDGDDDGNAGGVVPASS